MLGRRRQTQEEEVVIRVFQPGQTHHMRAALNEQLRFDLTHDLGSWAAVDSS